MQPVLKKKLQLYYQTGIIQSKSSWFSTGILSYSPTPKIRFWNTHITNQYLVSKYVCISKNLANQECLQLIYLPTFGIHKRVISPPAILIYIYMLAHIYYTTLQQVLNYYDHFFQKILWSAKLQTNRSLFRIIEMST